MIACKWVFMQLWMHGRAHGLEEQSTIFFGETSGGEGEGRVPEGHMRAHGWFVGVRKLHIRVQVQMDAL